MLHLFRIYDKSLLELFHSNSSSIFFNRTLDRILFVPQSPLFTGLIHGLFSSLVFIPVSGCLSCCAQSWFSVSRETLFYVRSLFLWRPTRDLNTAITCGAGLHLLLFILFTGFNEEPLVWPLNTPLPKILSQWFITEQLPHYTFSVTISFISVSQSSLRQVPFSWLSVTLLVLRQLLILSH